MSQRSSPAAKRGQPGVSESPLQALQLIETVGDGEPFSIVPIIQTVGHVVTPDERMAAKVRWAEQARYTILTRRVPTAFAPYNAIIRISERGTEDQRRDYLAHLTSEHEVGR